MVVTGANGWFLNEGWGDTGFAEVDEDGDFVPTTFDFTMIDSTSYRGKINGVDTGLVDLRSSNTTRLAWFFSDTQARYWICKCQCNYDFSLKTNPVYYSGCIDYSMIKRPAFYSENPGTSSQLILAHWQIQSSVVLDGLKKRDVNELVTGKNNNPIKVYPLTPFRQSDMINGTTTEWGTSRSQFFAGFVVEDTQSTLVGGNTLDNMVGSHVDPSLSNPQVISDVEPEIIRIAAYTADGFAFDRTDFGFTDVTDAHRPTNPYGIKYGFQAILYSTVLSKLAEAGVFTYSSSDVERVCQPYGQVASGDPNAWRLSGIGDTHLMDWTAMCYNTRFGVLPTQHLYTLNLSTSGGSLLSLYDDFLNNKIEVRTLSSVSSASPSVYTTSTPHGLTPGMDVYCVATGSDISAPLIVRFFTGSYEDAMIVDTVPSDTTFTLRDGSGAAVNGNNGNTTGTLYYYGDAIYQWEQPCSYQRAMKQDALLLDIAKRNRSIITWSYNQSGTHFGKPKLQLKRIGKSDGAAPTTISAAVHVKQPIVSNIHFSKPWVAVKHKGSDATVYCPRLPLPGEQGITIEYSGQTKKIGSPNGYLLSDWVFDTNSDVYNQYDCVYWCDNINDTRGTIHLTPRGWALGACDFYPYLPGAVPNVYNVTKGGTAWFDKSIVGFNGDRDVASTDKSGNYVLCCEEYTGTIEKSDGTTYTTGAVGETLPVNTIYYSDLGASTLIFANALLGSYTERIYVIDGIVDDSGTVAGMLQRHKLTIRDEFGNTAYIRCTKVLINELSNLTQLTTIDTVSDETILNEMPMFFSKGGVQSSIGGSPIGGGSGVGTGGGGGTATVTNDLITNPQSDTRNLTAPGDNVNTALTTQGFATEWLSITVADGTNNDVDITSATHHVGYTAIRITGTVTAAYTITGFNSGTEGKDLIIWNDTGQKLYFVNETGSSANNQISLTVFDNVIGTVHAHGTARLKYETTDNKWRLLSVFPVYTDFDTSEFSISQNSDGEEHVVLGTVPYGNIETIANDTVLGNNSGSTAAPSPISFSDVIGNLVTVESHNLAGLPGAGVVYDLAITGSSPIILSRMIQSPTTGNIQLRGMTAPASGSQVITIDNRMAAAGAASPTIQINHLDLTAALAQFYNPPGVNVTLTPGQTRTYIYNSTDGVWDELARGD